MILLEQKALFAQMNPHFIFNTLNSIKSFLIYNENDKAEYFLSKFSKLLRQTLHVSRNNSIAIQKEVNLLEKYLELEQMRFSNKFQWTIFHNLSEDELDLKIPNMLIQPSLENSIKHGFIEKRFDYKIQMNISLIGNDILICEIIDNGIGRKASFERKAVYSRKNEHKSYGEKITKERLKTYNKFQKNKFGTVILDEYDEYGNSCGTKSILTIPIIQS